MPLRVSCPTCAAVVQVPDEFAGRRVKCPKCKGTFLAPGQAPAQAEILDEPDEEEDEQEEERPRKAKPKKKKKRRTSDDDEYRGGGGPLDGMFANTSLPVLVIFPLCCGVIALILSIIGVATGRDPQAKSNATLVLIISVIWIIVATILQLAGVLDFRGGGR